MFSLLLLVTLIGCVSGNSVVIAKANSSASIPTLPFPNSIFQHKIRAEYLNEGPGHHLHTIDDELFHIFQGKVQIVVDGRQFCASSGDYVYVPRNIPQGIRVYNPTLSSPRVKIQIMLFPSGLENFLDEIALLYDNNQNNQTEIDRISTKYGIVSLPPVQWEELGCFNNFSLQLSSSVSFLIFVIFFKSILE